MTDEKPQTANEEYMDEADDDVVSLQETTLQRGDDGLLAQKVYVEEFGGHLWAKPLTRSEHKRFVGDLLEGEKDELSNSELAELFDKKITKPDLTAHELCNDHVTERFIEEGINQSQEDGYYIAILLASGDDDIVRRLRGEYNSTEMELIKEQMKEDGMDPQGNRTENEVRRNRR